MHHFSSDVIGAPSDVEGGGARDISATDAGGVGAKDSACMVESAARRCYASYPVRSPESTYIGAQETGDADDTLFCVIPNTNVGAKQSSDIHFRNHSKLRQEEQMPRRSSNEEVQLTHDTPWHLGSGGGLRRGAWWPQYLPPLESTNGRIDS